MKTLTAKQLEKIETFLEKKDVIYLDLKMELLDHISSSIENQWEKNPNLSFDKAFHNEYKNFGIHGFSEVITNREQDLNKYYWKSIGKHMLGWFKIPQIFFTILLFYVVFQLMNSEYNILVRNSAVILYFWAGIIQISFYYISKEIKKKKGLPILLMDKVIAKASGSLYFIYIVLQNSIFTLQKEIFSETKSIIWALFLTVLSLLFYHLIFDFPKNKRQYFKSNFIYG